MLPATECEREIGRGVTQSELGSRPPRVMEAAAVDLRLRHRRGLESGHGEIH
jgi:hypothetical protein